MFKIKICSSISDYKEARRITGDYIEWLNIDLSFQNIEEELKGFESVYGPPKGCYLLASGIEGATAGGVALREYSAGICEMKRLYVYPPYLGKGLGRPLCNELLKQAKQMGYKKMRLDTMTKLEAANRLYEKLGFYEIEPYRVNPEKTARFMEILL